MSVNLLNLRRISKRYPGVIALEAVSFELRAGEIWVNGAQRHFANPAEAIAAGIGVKREIHELIRNLAAEGRAIIVISSDLPEVMRLADRLGVMCKGRLAVFFRARKRRRKGLCIWRRGMMRACTVWRHDDKSFMIQVKVFYDKGGKTLTVWFGEPREEYIYEETGDEVILMKDKTGRVIGFEKLNFSVVQPQPLRVAFETMADCEMHKLVK